MAFNPDHLVTRHPVLDRHGEITFCRLTMAAADQNVVMPFMLRLTNIDVPQMVYFIPLEWVGDTVLLVKLAREMVLSTETAALEQDIAEQARQRGFRLAAMLGESDMRQPDSDFILLPFPLRERPLQGKMKTKGRGKVKMDDTAVLELQLFDSRAPEPIAQEPEASPGLPPNTILTGVETRADFEQAKTGNAMYFSGDFFMDCPLEISTKANIHPSHAVILELLAAVQKEADPKAMETIAKKDITLSFKLLRYVNSPFFGLTSRVESVRHAVSILGYQQLFKWLSLLAVTAGSGASPALTHAAMTRAKLMELLGKHMDRKEQDNLFVTGMLSLLDRIMRVPLEQVLKYVNLPDNVSDALLAGTGRYRRFLDLAMACEGMALPEDENFADIDVKAVNIAHLEAIEWATKLSKVGSH
ncbi:MAG: HDOD domain-containing protein [Nitrosomonadales bacterium]|nr:MAG: HDOD domain-containing protein [Nitrosomonadales bacterium]